MLPIDPPPNVNRGTTSLAPTSKSDQRKSGQETADGFQDVFQENAERPDRPGAESAVVSAALVPPKAYARTPSDQLFPAGPEDALDVLEASENIAVEPEKGSDPVFATASSFTATTDAKNLVPDRSDRPTASVKADAFGGKILEEAGNMSETDEATKRSADKDSLQLTQTLNSVSGATRDAATLLSGAQVPQPKEAVITLPKQGLILPSAATRHDTTVAAQSPQTAAAAVPQMLVAAQAEPALRRDPQTGPDLEKTTNQLTAAVNQLEAELATKVANSRSSLSNMSAFANFSEQSLLRENVDKIALFGPDAASKEAGMLVGQDATQRLAMSSPTVQLATPHNAQHATVSQQIAMQVSLQVSKARAGEIELRLEPEELGKLRITFLPREMGMTLSIVAERPETLELLRRNSDQLLADLGGMDLGQTSLEFSGGEQEWASQDGSPPSDVSEDKRTSVIVTPAVQVPGRLDIRL